MGPLNKIFYGYVPILCALCSSDVLTFITIPFLDDIGNRLIVLMVISVVTFLSQKNINSSIATRSVLLHYLSVLILIMLTVLTNYDMRGGYVLMVMSFTLSCLAVASDDYRVVIVKLSNVLNALAITSVVVYALEPIIKMVPFLPRGFNGSGLPLVNLFTCVLVDLPGYARLFGIFREPGVYCIVLVVALLLLSSRDDLELRRKNIIACAIVIASYLTYSISGYVSILLAFIVYSRTTNKGLNKRKSSSYLQVFIFILLLNFVRVIFFGAGGASELQNAIDKFTKKDTSYVQREATVYADLETWSNNIFFGAGLTEGYQETERIGAEKTNLKLHNTNTWTGYLMIYGVFLAFYIYYGYYRLAGVLFSASSDRTLAVISLLIAFSSQSLVNNGLVLMLPLIGLVGSARGRLVNAKL